MRQLCIPTSVSVLSCQQGSEISIVVIVVQVAAAEGCGRQASGGDRSGGQRRTRG